MEISQIGGLNRTKNRKIHLFSLHQATNAMTAFALDTLRYCFFANSQKGFLSIMNAKKLA